MPDTEGKDEREDDEATPGIGRMTLSWHSPTNDIPSPASLPDGVEEEVNEDEMVDLEASLASLPRHSRNVRMAILKAGGYRGCSEGAHLI